MFFKMFVNCFSSRLIITRNSQDVPHEAGAPSSRCTSAPLASWRRCTERRAATAAAGDQTLESIPGPEGRGVRTADPVSSRLVNAAVWLIGDT